MADTAPTGLGRAAVFVAACSTAVHLTLAMQALHHSAPASLLLVLMAGACLTCAPALWRGGGLRSWMTMLGLTGAMLFMHLQLCFDCGPMVHQAYESQGGLATHLVGKGLGSVAVWLMLTEMTLAVKAVVRVLVRRAKVA
ncbi:MAG: hypothetical protein ABI873_05245 [Marmoricola sp.]